MPGQGIFSNAINTGLTARDRLRQVKQEAQQAASKLRADVVKEQNAERERAFVRKGKNEKEFNTRITQIREQVPDMTPDMRAGVLDQITRLEGDFPEQDLGILGSEQFSTRYGLAAPTPVEGAGSPPPAAAASAGVALPDREQFSEAAATARLPKELHGRVAGFDTTASTYGKSAAARGAEFGVDPNHLLAIAQIESRGKPGVGTNTKGATGLMQITQVAKDEVGMSDADVNDPEVAMEVAAKFYRRMLDKFDGNSQKAIAAYNWGEGNVRRKGMSAMPKETRDYLKMFNAMTTGEPSSQERADTVRVLASYPALWQQSGFGSEQLFIDAKYGKSTTRAANQVMDDMAAYSPGYADRLDIMADTKMYPIARESLVLTYENMGLTDEKITAALARLDKTALMLQEGTDKEEATFQAKVDEVDDIVDRWFFGAEGGRLDPSITAMAENMREGTIASSNALRLEMKRVLSVSPDIDMLELEFLMADKFGSQIPGFDVADITKPGKRKPAKVGGSVFPTVPAGPMRDLFVAFPPDEYGTRRNGSGGVELEGKDGTTAVFDDVEDIAMFMANRAIVFTDELGASKPQPAPGTKAPSGKLPVKSGKQSIQVSTENQGGMVKVTVKEGNTSSTRIFANETDARVWTDRLHAEKLSEFGRAVQPKTPQAGRARKTAASSVFGGGGLR